MLAPGTVSYPPAKRGEQPKVAKIQYEQDMSATEWDRQNSINRMQQLLMEEERRRYQQEMRGPPPIFGGLKNGGNF
jgi:hypothetical protein